MARQEKCELLSEEEVSLVVRGTLRSVESRLLRYSIRPIGGGPTGFLGEHLRMTVEEEACTGKRELHYFIKKLPSAMQQHLEYAKATRAFYKEIELYRTLFVDLKRVQGSRTKWAPDYHYSRQEELMVIEDLAPLGYSMLPERSLMDEDCLRAALKCVAAMHAASIVFEERFRRGEATSVSPRCGGRGAETLLGDLYAHLTFETEISDVQDHPGNTFVLTGIDSQKCVVDLMKGYSEADKRIIREKLPAVLKRILQLVKPSDRYRNVFVHGDLWANNLLFRKGADGKVIDSVLVDFQLARYAPPAHDVMMLLYLVQNKDFRRRKEMEMLDHYYFAISEELSAAGIAADSAFPLSEFRDSCDHYRQLGMVSAVLYYQLIHAPSDISSKFMASPAMYEHVFFVDRSDMIKECIAQDDIYRTRMTEIMEEVISQLILRSE